VSPTPESQRSEDKTSPSGTNDETPAARHDEEARLFYERLEQTGQLVDVGASPGASPPRSASL
jgi:hypothetical protein